MQKTKLVRFCLLAAAALQLVFFAWSARAEPQSVNLFYTPYELDFGPVGVGLAAPQMVVTITNTGSLPLTGWAGGAVAAPFNASQDCNIAGGVLPGNSCHYFIDFTPAAPGTFQAVSNSSTNAGSISIVMHGRGVGASATYDAHALYFGDIFTSGFFPGSAPTQVVTIRNTGLAPLTGWAGGAVGPPFDASQDCNIAGGVLPGHECHYTFSFTTASGGIFTTTSNSSTNGGPIHVDLAGKAHLSFRFDPGQRVTPTSLDFGPVGVGVSANLSVAITNNSPANITGWAGGAVPAPFNGSQDCNIAGGQPVGSTCHFYYTFHPTSPGVASADSNASDSEGSFSIHMTGTGVAASMTVDALGLDFGPVPLGAEAKLVATITNTGLSPLTGWAGGAVPAPFNGSQDCNIAGGVLPGNSCHFFFTFSPTAKGSFSAQSNFSTNAGSFSVKMRGQSLVRVFIPMLHH